MANQYSQVFELVTQTKQIANSYQFSSASLSEIQKEMDNSVLNIMLYGAYNAGKSTLINVLSGKAVAPVADIPKTDKVDRYPWGDYVLLDTPGVNAPIQHEDVTLEQLTRCSVILFVIRDSDMDSKDVYERLFDLLRKDKKIFIVLNNQLSNEEDKYQAAQHIRDLLVKFAPNHQVNLDKLGEVEILPMNLRTALKGRELNKEPLLVHSGYSEFIERFNAWTAQQNSERQRFNGFKNFVNERWYSPLLEKITSLKSAQDQEKARELIDQKNELNERKNIIFNRVSDAIRMQSTSNREAISAILQNCSSESQIQSEMSHIFQKMSSSIEQTMQKELSDFNFSFNTNYSVSTGDLVPSHALADKMKDMGKNLLTDQNMLKEGLLIGRKLKIPPLKGRWEKTLGSWAGKAAVVLQVASAIWDIYSSQKEEEERNAQQRRAILELNQSVENITTDFINDAYQSVGEAINPFFDQQIAEVQHQLNALKSESNVLDEAFKTVTQSQTAMLAIQW